MTPRLAAIALVLLVSGSACQAPSDDATPSGRPAPGGSASPVAPEIELGTLAPEPTVPLPSSGASVAPDVELGTLAPEPTLGSGAGR